MKSILMFAIMTVSVLAMANSPDSAFKENTVVPAVLQQRILDAVQEKCSKLTSNYGLNEVVTSVRSERIDQGIVDYFYTTTFKSTYYFDGMHPASTYIEVVSAQYAFTNGDNLSILSVQSDAGCE